MMKWPMAMRSSGFTSLAPPLSAALFMVPRLQSGRYLRVSGYTSLLVCRMDDAFISRNSLRAAARRACTLLRLSSRRLIRLFSTDSLALRAASAAPSAPLYRSDSSDTIGTTMVWTLILRSPPELVYSSAHCTYATLEVSMFSSCAICTAKALSGSQVGSASRSVERLKKWPWKEEMRSRLLQRMRMTASQAVGRTRLWRTSASSFRPSRAALKPG
mmetsp:Transcript_558/g.1228  ORF Transcript_558/g.1228 Transcript_558/m.1228 type:complete len:216 (-) Transcript_558:2157-2804(-)